MTFNVKFLIDGEEKQEIFESTSGGFLAHFDAIDYLIGRFWGCKIVSVLEIK